MQFVKFLLSVFFVDFGFASLKSLPFQQTLNLCNAVDMYEAVVHLDSWKFYRFLYVWMFNKGLIFFYIFLMHYYFFYKIYVLWHMHLQYLGIRKKKLMHNDTKTILSCGFFYKYVITWLVTCVIFVKLLSADCFF